MTPAAPERTATIHRPGSTQFWYETTTQYVDRLATIMMTLVGATWPTQPVTIEWRDIFGRRIVARSA